MHALDFLEILESLTHIEHLDFNLLTQRLHKINSLSYH